MKKLCSIFFAFVLFACATKPKQKELFTPEELKLINENKDILNTKELSLAENDTDNYIFLLYALKAVKLDTTIYRNTFFKIKGDRYEGMRNIDLYDSLCERYYGTKIMSISTAEYSEKMGINSIDSLFMPNKKRKKFPKGYPQFIFDNIVYLIKEKYHYTGIDRNKAYWEEREISFYRHYNSYNNHTDAQFKEAVDFLKGKTRNLTLREIADGNEWLHYYCQSKQPCHAQFLNCNDTLRKMIYENDPYKLMNVEDLRKLMAPIIVTYDSMGVLQNVSCKNKKYVKPLFDLYSKLNGQQEIKLLNKKRIGFSFYALVGKYN